MSTLSPVADPTASMPPAADFADVVELPDSTGPTMTGGVPDPTEGNTLDLLDTGDTEPHQLSSEATAGHVAVTTTAPATAVLQPPTPTASGAVAEGATTPKTTTGPATGGAGSKRKKSPTHPVTVQMATAATASSTSNQGENTGRWTSEEHQLFLQGLEIHGKGWKKIAGLIKSRTVVQIRTHAQKYFQKLAKAKQNGEEGEVMMEGRGVPVSVAASMPASSSSGTGTQANKRRKHSTTGTKRKVISSVVASAQRQSKKSAKSLSNRSKSLPVAPVLAPYVLPPRDASSICSEGSKSQAASITEPMMEDALFRFLTPVPVANMEPQVNEVARQAGANPITLPQDSQNVSSLAGGEISPTGVADWVDPYKDVPSWYAKGADVDALFDVAETLDWLADTGDLNENYDNVDLDNVAPVPVNTAPTMPSSLAPKTVSAPAPTVGTASAAFPSTTSMNTIPRIDSGAQVVVPPLPSLFDGGASGVKSSSSAAGPDDHDVDNKLVLHNLNSTSVSDLAGHVFDTHDEEEEFVSTILD